MPRLSSFKSFITIHNRTVPSIFGSIGKNKEEPTPSREEKKDEKSEKKPSEEKKEPDRASIPTIFASIGHHKDVPVKQKKGIKEWWEQGVPASKFHKEVEKDNSFANVGTDIDYDKYDSESAKNSSELDKHFHGTAEESKEKEKNFALKNYTSDSSPLNAHLINSHKHEYDPTDAETEEKLKKHGEHTPSIDYDTGDEIKKHILLRKMDQSMKNFSKPIHKDMHVYTGIGRNFNVLKLREAGHDKVHLPAFTSTSTDPDIAHSFSKSDPDRKTYKEMIRIHLPEGSKHGIHLGNASNLPEEREFLINRGKTLKFKDEPRIIVRKDFKGNVHHIVMHDADIVDHEHEKKPSETTTVKESNMKTFKNFNEQSGTVPPPEVLEPGVHIVRAGHSVKDGKVKQEYAINRYKYGFNTLPHKKSKVERGG